MEVNVQTASLLYSLNTMCCCIMLLGLYIIV